MIDPAGALRVLLQAGVGFFSGVPDSLLKELNACVAAEVDPSRHVVAHNEGGAVGLAAGHYLATGELGVVYMQNSGLGNAVNPLISLTAPQVYGIPMVLMVGWRGRPGAHDEPQHLHQGRVTEEMLQLLDIPVHHLHPGLTDWAGVIKEAVEQSRSASRPVALLVWAGTFSSYQGQRDNGLAGELPSRLEALGVVVDSLPEKTFFVATTGYTARELAALRSSRGEVGDRDLLVVGSMGHASSIALGMALAQPEESVVCLDGDGSLVMHLGAMATIGMRRPRNLGHMVFNNGVHESVGGQPSALGATNVVDVAVATGYHSAARCDNLDRLAELVETAAGEGGPWFVEVRVRQGTMSGLPRPEDFAVRVRSLKEVMQS